MWEAGKVVCGEGVREPSARSLGCRGWRERGGGGGGEEGRGRGRRWREGGREGGVVLVVVEGRRVVVVEETWDQQLLSQPSAPPSVLLLVVQAADGGADYPLHGVLIVLLNNFFNRDWEEVECINVMYTKGGIRYTFIRFNPKVARPLFGGTKAKVVEAALFPLVFPITFLRRSGIRLRTLFRRKTKRNIKNFL